MTGKGCTDPATTSTELLSKSGTSVLSGTLLCRDFSPERPSKTLTPVVPVPTLSILDWSPNKNPVVERWTVLPSLLRRTVLDGSMYDQSPKASRGNRSRRSRHLIRLYRLDGPPVEDLRGGRGNTSDTSVTAPGVLSAGLWSVRPYTHREPRNKGGRD